MVLVKDGRRFYGTLEAVDNKKNIVLKHAIEEIPMKNYSLANDHVEHHLRK